MSVKCEAVIFSMKNGTYGYWVAKGVESGEVLLNAQQLSLPPGTTTTLFKDFNFLLLHGASLQPSGG